MEILDHQIIGRFSITPTYVTPNKYLFMTDNSTQAIQNILVLQGFLKAWMALKLPNEERSNANIIKGYNDKYCNNSLQFVKYLKSYILMYNLCVEFHRVFLGVFVIR